MPSWSYNEDLGAYLCFFETGVGEAAAVSSDGIRWSEPKLVMEFTKVNSEPRGTDLKDGEEFLQYFSALSDGTTPTDSTTKGPMIGYVSSRPMTRNPDGTIKSFPAHNLVARDIKAA